MLIPRRDFAGTDRFAVELLLGRGGFGTVYQVYDRQRRAQVALKILHRADASALFRLKQEFRALADLSHPNLASLYELLSQGDLWFITMELVAGRTFTDFVRGELTPEHQLPAAPVFPDDDMETGVRPPMMPREFKPAVTPDTIERLEASLRQLALGLHYLHSAGKLHRDIKPSNVLVTKEGRVVLLDFGLVTERGEAVDLGLEIVGTPLYMAPEQSADTFSEATDWYSVGVMVFELLTGKLPFRGTMTEVMQTKRERDAPDPREFASEVPPHLNKLCRDLLSRRPDVRLEAAHTLLQSASRRSVAALRSAAAVSASTPFVGRTEYLAELDAAYDAAKAGRAVRMFVHGSSGIGKSALVRHFLQTVHDRDPDAIILSGRCFERESVPYKALDSVVDALSVHLRKLPRATADALLPRDVPALVRLFPVLRRVEAIAAARLRVAEIPDSQELRRRAFAAFRELISRLSDRQPLVLFIDDLQWGDADGAALLADLLRGPDPPALLLVATYRTEEAASSVSLRMLLRGGSLSADDAEAREIAVGRLRDEEARALAEALMTGEAGTGWDADAVVKESGGNPYFIDELARYAKPPEPASGGRSGLNAEPADTGTSEITLDAVINERVHLLPEAPRRLLEVLSVFGQPLDLSVASAAARIPSHALDALRVLRAERLSRTRVVEDREEIETYHDRIRETVVTHLEPVQLLRHHQALALALESFPGADPEALMVHFQGGGDDIRAARYALKAAERAADALAFDRAARLYRQALDLYEDEPAVRHGILVKLGDALANAGRGRDAAHAYLDAVKGTTTADRLELQRRASEQLLRSGHIEEAFDTIHAVLATMGMRLAASPRQALASAILRRLQIRLRGLRFREREVTQIAPETLVRIDACWSVAIGLGIVDNVRGADFQARHLLLALSTGEPYRITRALAIEVAYSSVPGGPRAVRRTNRVARMAERLAERVGNPHGIGLVGVSRGTGEHLLGHWKAAAELCERSELILRERCTGTAWELSIAHLYGLRSLYFLGKLGEISRRLPVLLKEARERDDLNAVTNLQTGVSYIARLAADEPEKARADVREGIGQWYQKGFTAQHYFELLASAEIALYAGDGLAAWAHVERQWRALERSLLLRIELVFTESLSVRARSAVAAAAATTDPARRSPLLRTASRLAARLSRRRIGAARPLAALVEVGIASLTNKGQAVTLLEHAIEEFEGLDMPLHAAVARRRLGELTGDDRGRLLIEDADAWMRGHGIRNPRRMAMMLAPTLT